jgi:hypothetical protein
MGLFDKVKRSMGFQDESLRERGIKGTAKVLSSKKTMMSSGDDSSSVPIYKETLLVTVPGTEPYEVTYKVEGGLTEGAEYPVYVDHEDPNKVFVEDTNVTNAIGGVANALSQFSGQPVGTDMGSIQQAVTNLPGSAGAPGATAVPGITPEWQQMMAKNAKAALEFVKDPAQRKMLIEQYRAAGVPIDDAVS